MASSEGAERQTQAIVVAPGASASSVSSADSPARGSMFSALRIRNYRLFWTGQLVSVTGTFMQSTAQRWLVLKLTHEPASARHRRRASVRSDAVSGTRRLRHRRPLAAPLCAGADAIGGRHPGADPLAAHRYRRCPGLASLHTRAAAWRRQRGRYADAPIVRQRISPVQAAHQRRLAQFRAVQRRAYCWSRPGGAADRALRRAVSLPAQCHQLSLSSSA